MRTDPVVSFAGQPEVKRRATPLLRHIILNLLALVGAAALYVAHEHWSVSGQSTPALVALIGSAVLALVPLRAVLGRLFALEGKVMHLLHGIGGLALIGLFASGVVSGGPLLTHAALAPFAVMGAAQAVMHQNHPRNAQQAEALRRFATSLPEVAQFTKSGSLASPQNAARAVVVLRDLLGKAEALGYTELDADPGFQSALRQATTRFGLTLGLDQADKVITALADNPKTASAVPALRQQLAKARRVAEQRPPG
jgi:hypothetical protein